MHTVDNALQWLAQLLQIGPSIGAAISHGGRNEIAADEMAFS
jgi:hypothetical protein